MHCTSGEALVQEAAASGQFAQQKRVLVYEWLFLGLACCFLPRIHDCELNCSCWFITSLLGYKVGLLSNSSLGKKHNSNNNTSAANLIPLAQKVPLWVGVLPLPIMLPLSRPSMCFEWKGHGLDFQCSIKFGWTPKLSCVKTSWTHSFPKNAASSVQCALYQLLLL